MFKRGSRVALGCVVASSAIALSLAGMAPASASTAPANDSIANAMDIAPVPFHDYIPDLAAATWDWSDPYGCGYAMSSSVWYRFHATSDAPLAFDVGSSSAWLDMSVYTGEPSALTQVACSTQTAGMVFNPTADTDYYVMFSLDGLTGGGSLNLFVFPPAPPTVTATVNPIAIVDRGSNLTVSGAVVVNGLATTGGSFGFPPQLSGTVSQVYKRINTISAQIAVGFPTPVPETVKWSVTPAPTGGGFAQGYATVRLDGSFCNIAGCTPVSIVQVVRVVKK